MAVIEIARHVGLSTNIISRAAATISIGIQTKMVFSVLAIVLWVRSISEAINSVRFSLYAFWKVFRRE